MGISLCDKKDIKEEFYMLKKYEIKKVKMGDCISKFLLSCLGLELAFCILISIYKEEMFGKLGIVICIIALFSLLIEKIAIKRLKKRSDQEIQEFEEKYPIGKRVSIYIDWIEMHNNYSSLSNEQKEMLSYLDGKQQELYLLREKNLDGDSFTIECEGSRYPVYACMSRDYDKMTELTQKYYKAKE